MDFFVTLHTPEGREPLLDALPFASLEAAYLDFCAAIPATAADLLHKRRNPFRCAFVISDGDGVAIMDVPLADVLPPSERPDATSPPRKPPDARNARLQVELDRARQLCRTAAQLHHRAAALVNSSPAPAGRAH